MRLVNIYDYEEEVRIITLWDLLGERLPHQNISHKAMPTKEEHAAFVERKPYPVWYFICPNADLDLIYGSIYLTQNREIGIHIFRCYQGYGVGTKAIQELMAIHNGPFYANIAPSNDGSQAFFERMGFRHIQNTYKFGE